MEVLYVMNKDIEKILVSEEELAKTVLRIAKQIDKDYAGDDKNLVLVCILKGSIVFIGSNSAVRVTENRCAYCSSKNAIIAMSKSFAVDWGKYGIRSNVVLPGMIKTDRWHNNVNGAKYCLPNYTPIRDIAEFEDVANAAWYF